MADQLGIIAVLIMVASYALEERHPIFVLIFAFGCALAATYAWLIGSLPFVFAEGIWSLIALRRWVKSHKSFGDVSPG